MKSAFLTFVLAASTLLSAEPTAPAKPTPAKQPATSTAKIVDLRVESQTNPTAVNNPLPRFSWRIETEERGWLQKSYQILVASTPELLAEDKGDLWDSEDVTGTSSHFIPFKGAVLSSDQRGYWKVRSKDLSDKISLWSDPSVFTIKLSGPPVLPTPLFLPVSSTPRLSSFECSDPNLNTIYELAAQRLHEITSVRDIGLLMRAAAYHQGIHPRASAWLHHMNASIDAAGLYPAKLPSDGSYGSTRSDAAVSATHSLWWMTGDTALCHRHMDSLLRYVLTRGQIDESSLGRAFGTLPEDTLLSNDPTPPAFIHSTTHALNLRLMLEIGRFASRNPYEFQGFDQYFVSLREPFVRSNFHSDGSLIHDSIAAHVVALRTGLISDDKNKKAVQKKLMLLLDETTTSKVFEEGPLVTSGLLPVLTWSGYHDRAISIARAQNPDVIQPTTLASISEWLIAMVGGIGTELPGFNSIMIAPHFPKSDVLSFAKASYDSPHGRIVSNWHYEGNEIYIQISVPPNTIAHVRLPLENEKLKVTQNGHELIESEELKDLKRHPTSISFHVVPGSYSFKIGE